MTARRLRVAQVATSDMSVKLLLAGQIRAMQQAGWDVTAICAPGPWVEEARASGIPVREVPMVRRFSPTQDMRSFVALIRAFREGGYDVVNTHTPKAGIIGPLAARIAGVPAVIHTVHGFLFHDRMPRRQRLAFAAVERFTAATSHALFFQSREDEATARDRGFLPDDALLYIGNGIDLARFEPATAPRRAEVRAAMGWAPGDIVVGMVGRLTYEKGYAELFEAARALLARRGDFRFVIVGPIEGDRGDAVRPNEMRGLEATGRVHFLGLRRDVPDLLAGMDLFVLPSYREGIPRALMEACAMGLPVVATDIRGCREVVEDGVSGFLVPVRDGAALAQAIERMAAMPDLGRAMGVSGRARVIRHFGEAAVHQRVLAGVEAVADRRLRRTATGLPYALEEVRLPSKARGTCVLSIDLEDWHQLAARRATGRFPPPNERVIDQTRSILRLLDETGVKATFFVLATIAEAFPDLVRDLHRRGHEVASHGCRHIPLHRMDDAQVRDDVRRSMALLEDLTGEPVKGFRAPEFSVTARNPQVLQTLADLGLRYDSSIFPIHQRRYGVPSFPRGPTRVRLGASTLLELPLATWRIAGANLPVAGGGYSRLLPGALLHRGVSSSAAAGRLPVLYFHPYEFDDQPLRAPPGADGSWRYAVWERMQNLGHGASPGMLRQILRSMRTLRCQDVLEMTTPSAPSASSPPTAAPVLAGVTA